MNEGESLMRKLRQKEESSVSGSGLSVMGRIRESHGEGTGRVRGWVAKSVRLMKGWTHSRGGRGGVDEEEEKERVGRGG